MSPDLSTGWFPAEPTEFNPISVAIWGGLDFIPRPIAGRPAIIWGRLASIPESEATKRILVYATDHEMARYMSNPKNGLKDFYVLLPGHTLEIGPGFVASKSRTFQNAIAGDLRHPISVTCTPQIRDVGTCKSVTHATDAKKAPRKGIGGTDGSGGSLERGAIFVSNPGGSRNEGCNSNPPGTEAQ